MQQLQCATVRMFVAYYRSWHALLRPRLPSSALVRPCGPQFVHRLVKHVATMRPPKPSGFLTRPLAKLRPGPPSAYEIVTAGSRSIIFQLLRPFPIQLAEPKRTTSSRRRPF
jgi:hypothetical protein